MFCGKCGSRNPDGALFCAGCGAPLTAQPTNANPTQTPAAQGYTPAAQPTNPAPNKNLLPWIIAGVAVVAAIVVTLILLLGGKDDKDSGGSSGGSSASASDVGLSFAKAILGGNSSKALKLVYPDMIDDETREGFEQIAEYYAEYITLEDASVSDEESGTQDDIEDYEERFEDEFDLDVDISKLTYVEIEFSYTSDFYGDGTETISVVVAKIDGSWYVIDA